jgi:hypothetical protein
VAGVGVGTSTGCACITFAGPNPNTGNPGVMPFKMANVLSAKLAHPLMVFLMVPAVAHIHPQTGSLMMAGHACACPLMGLLAVATQAHLSLFVAAVLHSRLGAR